MNQPEEDIAAPVATTKEETVMEEVAKSEVETSSSTEVKNMEDDDNDNATVDTENVEDEEKGDGISLKDPTTLIMRAVSHKEEGNSAFKNGDYSGATRAYRKGTNLIKSLNEGNTGDEQVKALLINLQTNLSMSCLKQNKPKLSRDVASKALAIQEDHVKALFRRAAAHRSLGDLDLAKKDLKRALQKDPVNRDCKRSLISVQREIDQRHEKQKQALSRAFSGGGSSFLYDDKEQELLRKKKEKEEMKKQKEIEKQKRKKVWEDECVKMMVENPDEKPPSFEDWDKEQQKKEKELEKKRKEEEEKRRQAAKPKPTRKKTASKKDESDDDDDDKLTESELQMMRGYKKTSDGRTTSYFNREQTEEEKKLLGSIVPQRLDNPQRLDSVNNTLDQTIPTPLNNATLSASKWNSAGTWEERDTTEWCRKALESHLMTAATKHSSNYMAVVKEVNDLTGDASVAVVARGKSYLFDFHCKLKFEIQMEDGKKIASGTLSLPDISSTSITQKDGSDLDIEVMGWKKSPQDVHFNISCECREQLVKVVRSCVVSFVEEFNSQY